VSLQDAFELPPDARVQQTGGGGSLVSRVRWQHADGSTATWESRLVRKRGFIEVVRNGVVMRIMARPAVAVRLRRCNDLSGVSFFLGGGLFTLGALLAQYGGASLPPIDWTFLIGGIWFSTGAYAALVQEQLGLTPGSPADVLAGLDDDERSLRADHVIKTGLAPASGASA